MLCFQMVVATHHNIKAAAPTSQNHMFNRWRRTAERQFREEIFRHLPKRKNCRSNLNKSYIDVARFVTEEHERLQDAGNAE